MNIYIRNLSYRLTDQELQDAFAQFGEVSSAKIIRDKMSNRSKGFGFVEMPNDEQAQTAMQQLNGAEIGGRAVQVSEARPPKPRNDRY